MLRMRMRMRLMMIVVDECVEEHGRHRQGVEVVAAAEMVESDVEDDVVV
jgi:hypothetical protein